MLSSDRKKMLALMLYEPLWQYYVKYKRFLEELKHPFLANVEFHTDEQMNIREETVLKYGAVSFFYHDSLKQLYPEAYSYAKRIEDICKRHDIPFLNKPDALSDSAKSIQLKLLAENGFKAAQVYPFANWKELLENEEMRYPIFIRYDCGHDSLGEGYSEPFHSREELLASKIWEQRKWEKTEHLDGLVAVGWLDTRSEDGLYRKYRVFAFGDAVLRGPLQISDQWFVHGNNALREEAFQKEAEQFLAGEFSAEEKQYFLRVNNALGLDFSAIDYSYQLDGKIVIWEANPHPSLGEWAENEPFKTKFTNNLSRFYNSRLA